MPLDFEFPSKVRDLITTIGPWDFFDIMVVAIILYASYQQIQDTRAITLLKGLMFIVVSRIVCDQMNLHVMTWLLQRISEWFWIALPILFQPELRYVLEQIGKGKFILNAELLPDKQDADKAVEEIVTAAKKLSQTKTGALMVIEREIKLNDLIRSTGIRIDGLISSELLLNIFIVNTPLHDGATIIRGNRLISSACVLPLTERQDLSTELGTRHRAAIGLSERSDALIIVVSEETGTISVAENGHLTRRFDEQTLAAKIRPAFVYKEDKPLEKFFAKWKNYK